LDNFKFLPVPEYYQLGVAPDWDFEVFTGGLQKLSGSKPEQACEKLCRLLLHLSHADLSDDVKIQYLEEIVRHVEVVEGKLDALYLDLPAPLPGSLQSGLQWLVWSYYLIANNFHQIAKNCSDQEQRRKAGFLFKALISLRHTYRHVAASYFQPMTGFWLLCYQIYVQAERDNLLEYAIEQKREHTLTIDALFKSILAFSLCDFQQFRPREMRDLFAIFEFFSSAMDLSRVANPASMKGVCFIDLQEDRQPVSFARETEFEQNPEYRFFSPVNLAKALHQESNEERENNRLLNSLSKASISRAIKTLGQAQKRLHRRLPDNTVGLGLVGFNNILQYLQKDNEPELKSATTTASVKPVGPYDYDTSQFSLVEHGEEFIFQMNDRMRQQYENKDTLGKIVKASGNPRENVDIWGGDEKKGDVIEPESMALFNTSASGYGILLNLKQTKVKIGDLFAIIPEAQEKIELTVIRHLHRVTKHSLNIGVELIAAKGVSARVQGSTSHTQAIFVPGIQSLHKPDSLIFSFPQFNIGEMVEFYKEGELVTGRLHKTVVSTASFCQIEIYYPNKKA
jgi:hypothetical protein